MQNEETLRQLAEKFDLEVFMNKVDDDEFLCAGFKDRHDWNEWIFAVADENDMDKGYSILVWHVDHDVRLTEEDCSRLLDTGLIPEMDSGCVPYSVGLAQNSVDVGPRQRRPNGGCFGRAEQMDAHRHESVVLDRTRR